MSLRTTENRFILQRSSLELLQYLNNKIYTLFPELIGYLFGFLQSIAGGECLTESLIQSEVCYRWT